MFPSRSTPAVSRRTALAGLSASGLALALTTTHPVAAQDDAAALATHPLVGLWQYNSAEPEQAPDWFVEIFHADGTYAVWGGLSIGAAQGLWRPTGARTAEMLLVWRDTDLSVEIEGSGTTTFRTALTVDDASALLTRSSSTIDIRDPYGAPVFSREFPLGPSTRVTFDRNPATGSTIPEATPTASRPMTSR